MAYNMARDKGTMAAEAVARWLTGATGFKCTRTPQYGRYDRGDVQGIPNLMVEVKNTKTFLMPKWTGEVEAQCVNAECGYGVLLWSPPGIGVTRVGQWLAVEWEDSCLGSWQRRNSLGYRGPIRGWEKHVLPGTTTYRMDPATGYLVCRARRADDWLAELIDHLAANSRVAVPPRV